MEAYGHKKSYPKKKNGGDEDKYYPNLYLISSQKTGNRQERMLYRVDIPAWSLHALRRADVPVQNICTLYDQKSKLSQAQNVSTKMKSDH